MPAKPLSPRWQKIHDVVVAIPRGKVMTYGQIAEAAGMRGAARQVGYAMHAFGRSVPWQRVLGQRRRGVAQVSIADPEIGAEQRRRLEREGVRFSESGGVDLAIYGHPTTRKKTEQ